jgi:hypothetical protein
MNNKVHIAQTDILDYYSSVINYFNPSTHLYSLTNLVLKALMNDGYFEVMGYFMGYRVIDHTSEYYITLTSNNKVYYRRKIK